MQSLQKQKKSSIFRTVMCRILDTYEVLLGPNYLWYKTLGRFLGYMPNSPQNDGEEKFFTKKHITHNKQFLIH